MFDGNFRPEVEAKLRPVGHQLKKSGIRADHLTVAGLVMAIAASVALAMGSFHLAFLLVIRTSWTVPWRRLPVLLALVAPSSTP